MNRILSSAVKVAGSLAVVGGVVVAAAMPAGAAPPTRSWGVEASGTIHVFPVALATFFNTPQTSSGVNVPDLVTTSGILDRASGTIAYSQVGSPRVYVDGTITDQLNATMASSFCEIGGLSTSGTSVIQAGSITQTGQPTIALPRDPGVNTKIFIPGATITLNKQGVIAGLRTVTAIYVSMPGQTVSIGVAKC